MAATPGAGQARALGAFDPSRAILAAPRRVGPPCPALSQMAPVVVGAIGGGGRPTGRAGPSKGGPRGPTGIAHGRPTAGASFVAPRVGGAVIRGVAGILAGTGRREGACKRSPGEEGAAPHGAGSTRRARVSIGVAPIGCVGVARSKVAPLRGVRAYGPG